jgi:hypothetical protein
MNDFQTQRNATAAGIGDAVGNLLTAAVIVMFVIAFFEFLGPLLGIGLALVGLVAWLLLWLVYRGVKWFLPSSFDARSSARQYIVDRAAFLREHSCDAVSWSRTERDYLRCQAWMRAEGACPSNWGLPFEEWRRDPARAVDEQTARELAHEAAIAKVQLARAFWSEGDVVAWRERQRAE